MKSNWIWITLAVLVVLLLAVFMLMKRSVASGSGDEISGTDWTVYGSHNCGWTTKQLAEMDSKDVGYTFVDCEIWSPYPYTSSGGGTGGRLRCFKYILPSGTVFYC